VAELPITNLVPEHFLAPYANRLHHIRSDDPRLDAVLELARLEDVLRVPGAVDLYGVVTMYKARIVRRRDSGNRDEILEQLADLVDDVIRASAAA
jgi:hypothetical protein